MAEENQGQESGSPSGETTTGQEPLVADSPSAALTDQIVQAAKKMEESAASEVVKEPVMEAKPEEKEKPPPYDQDPKWKSARAAEKRQREILEKHGFEDADALEAALEKGITITEALGDRDAKKLLQDFTELKAWEQDVKAYWARKEQEAAEAAEAELEPNELAEKKAAEARQARKELADYKAAEAAKKAETEKAEADKAELAAFTDTVGSVVEKHGFDKDTAEIAKMFLGVDNPFNTVDISDKKAVRAMADSGVKKLSDFIATIKQSAIDEYAAGKSKFTPISATLETKPAVAAKDEEVPKGLSVSEAFSATTKRILERISGGMSP